MPTKLFHNPRCSKSRQALKILEESGVPFEVYAYLKEGLSIRSIEQLCKQLGEDTPWGFMRKKEAICKELGLSSDTSKKALVQAVHKHPILLERPILQHNGKAIVGRPPEDILEIL